jgi:hypothetical protein
MLGSKAFGSAVCSVLKRCRGGVSLTVAIAVSIGYPDNILSFAPQYVAFRSAVPFSLVLIALLTATARRWTGLGRR